MFMSRWISTSGVCHDSDECDLNLDNCDENADCFNTPGDFECDCKTGWDGDGIHCADVDECSWNSVRNHTCLDTEICQNTIGDFTCSSVDCESIENSANVQCDHTGMVISFPKCVFDKFQLADFYMAGPSKDLNIFHKNDLNYKLLAIFLYKI